MEILTVDVIGIPSGISSDLTNARVFQDYDAVVVDPEDLGRLYGRIDYRSRDNGILTSESGGILSNVNEQRREQVNGLLQRGGVVVCFMQPLETRSYTWRYEGEDYPSSVTNYDWLLKSKDINRELGEIKYSKGKTIDYIDSGNPFSGYLNTRPSWSAYVDTDDCENWKVIASAFGTHAVSLVKRVGLGHIILLPSYYHYENGELLENCIKTLLKGKDITPQPNWAKAILAPGQEQTISKISHLNEQVIALEKERESLAHDNDKLERWKYLLYEKGKHQLEPVVRDAIALLGCKVKPQPDKDSDGTVACDYGIALLEIVGSKGTIKIEKLGELTKNMGNYIAKKGSNVKGILVGNSFCEEPLDNRPPKNNQKQLFAKELIDSAEQQSIAVLLTTDLYQVVSRILQGEFSEAEAKSLQDRIFNGKGLVKLV